MFFSLQRRFLIFLLIPVVLILVVTGFASFLYARSYLMNQWRSTAELRLQRAAHQIEMRLNLKRELINSIAEAEKTADEKAIQEFMIKKLMRQPGVRTVNIETAKPGEEVHPPGLCLCFPTPKTRQVGSPETLTLMQCFRDQEGTPLKKIEVVVGVDSFLENVFEEEQWQRSHLCLVTSDGTYIAHSDKTMYGIVKLGDSGDALDRELLKEIKDKRSGFLSGKGHPPDWVIGFTNVRSTDWYLVSYSRGSVVFAPFVQFRLVYVLAGIAVAIIIALLIQWNTRSVAQSVAEISQAATRVAQGDFNARVPVDRSDEIGRLAQDFNRMIDDLRQRELIEGMFGRYVDKSVAQELMKRPEVFNLGGVEHVVTIMFADLRGFTPVAEKLPPDRVIKMLNRYFGLMIAVIDKYGGVIVDFYGDALLAFFDGLGEDTATRAYDAVNAALEMQRAHRQASKDNEKEGLPALKMGIGIHTGEVVIGNIGSETRAKYGIVGSSVNETHRIQQEAGGGEILISQQTHEVLADRLVLGTVTKVTLKGLEGDRTLYHVKGISEEI